MSERSASAALVQGHGETGVRPGRTVARPSGARYWPGLDGMRAIAVVAVVVYHLSPGLLPGGFLGVDLFFVISGYLITTLVTDEWRRRGRFGLVRFWGRRVRRLYPAVLALIAVLVPVTALFDPGALASSRITILAALVYLTNWWFIFHHVSYFQRFGPPPMLLHLWSLAIEEQYYLIWPPVLVLLLRRWGRPNRIAAVAVGAAAASVLAMGVLYTGASSIDRVYFGSDTHAFGLLIGSAIGLAVPPTGFPAMIADGPRRILDRVGLASIAVLVALMLVLGQGDSFTWRGGILLAVLAGGAAVVVAAHPASRCGRVLAARPLRWCGSRSYSIYVWHWPVIVLTEHGGVEPMGGFPRLLVRVVLIVALAEASYRFVEQPWRTGQAQRAMRRALVGSSRRRRGVLAGGSFAVAGLAALVVLASAPLAPPGLRLTSTPAARGPVGPSHAPPAPENGAPGATGSGPPGSTGYVGPRAGGPVLAIGDSVLLASYDDLRRAFGSKITVDAVVGRQPYTGLDRLAQYRSAGDLRGLRALVIALGSNGVFSSSELDQLRQLAAGVPLVVLVNVRVPDPWQGPSDATIAAARHLPGYRVVDWYAASAAKGVLYPDMVHPDLRGQRIYTRLVVKAITGR